MTVKMLQKMQMASTQRELLLERDPPANYVKAKGIEQDVSCRRDRKDQPRFTP